MRALCLVMLSAGCSASGTGVILQLLGQGSVDQIDVVGDWNGASHRAGHSSVGSPLILPTEVLVMLPDASVTARFTVSASLGGTPSGEGSTGDVAVTPHAIARASVTLSVGADLSVPPDLSALPDLAEAPPDLTGADLAGADLTPLPDLLPACTGPRCPYAYRRRVTVMNSSGGTLGTGYTVRVTLPSLTGKTRSDLADLRVFEDAPNQERDRVVDTAPPGQQPAAWFALGAAIAAGASDNNYWLYYGDPNAAAGPQDGKNVFAFYDDFPGAALDAHWTANGSPSVSGGNLLLHQNTQEAVRSNYLTDNVPVLSAFEIRASVSNPASASQTTADGSFWYWFGYQQQNLLTPPADPWILWISRGVNGVNAERKVNQSPSASPCYPTGCEDAALTQNTAFHWYRIERGATQTRFFYDGTAQTPITDNNNSADDYSLIIRNWAVTSDLTVDWVRARSLASPEPTVTVGAEEVLH